MFRHDLSVGAGLPEERSKAHLGLVQLVRGNVITLKQGNSFIRKINEGHLTLRQASLLMHYLTPEELRRMMSVLSKGQKQAQRKERFYTEDLPLLIRLAEHRASSASR